MVFYGNLSSSSGHTKTFEFIGELLWPFAAIGDDNAFLFQPVCEGNLIYQEEIKDDDVIRLVYLRTCPYRFIIYR